MYDNVSHLGAFAVLQSPFCSRSGCGSGIAKRK